MGHLSLEIISQSPPFGRTCGGQEATCPQRRENKPASEKIAKTRRSSSKAKSRKEIGAAKST